MRALVIDDSRAMRALLGRLLGEIGFAVDEAGNGREGLEHLGTHGAPDVVLVDWNMPEMSGFEFVQAVRANRDYDAVLPTAPPPSPADFGCGGSPSGAFVD